MPGEQDLVKYGNGNIGYTNPNAGMNQVGFPAGNSNGQRLKVTVTGTKSSIKYQGGDSSPHSFKAMEIAMLIAKKR